MDAQTPILDQQAESSKSEQADDQYAQLRQLKTALRSDLKITRTSIRGVPTYVVFDPTKFQSHRLTLVDYLVAGSLAENRSLQESLEQCIADDVLEADDEETFFSFVNQLQSLGLLTTSKEDPGKLYEKFQRQQEAKQKTAARSLLFATIPLAEPDAFLGKTLRYFSWLFTKTALLIWAILGLGATAIAIRRFEEFTSPLNGILATNNLIFLTVSFVALKIVHEFGHGYACKKFGGSVPEMGCKLIIMMPLAYVDATSAWSFPKRSHRLAVMLAGIYLEAIIAIIGVYIWAIAPHSFIGSCAFQLIFIAGVATVLFNANPLMKYDGYFVLSDLLGLPNLRARATKHLNAVLKWAFLGLPVNDETSVRDKFIFLSYGFAAGIYSTVLTISISFMIATMMGAIGILIAIVQITNMAWKSIFGFFNYLLRSEETKNVRFRATAIALIVGLGVPLLIGYFPVPGRVVVTGLSSGSELISVRTKTGGFVALIGNREANQVAKDEVLVTLKNMKIEGDHAVQQINSDLAHRKAVSISREDLSEGRKHEVMASESRVRTEFLRDEVDSLTIRAPQTGRLVYLLDENRTGSFIPPGEVVAKIVAGKCQIRAWVSEEQLSNSDIQFERKIELRLADRPLDTFHGTIKSLAPAKQGSFDDLALTTLGNGSIKINPETGETEENLYMLEIEVDNLDADEIRLDSRVRVVLKRRYQSLAGWAVKSLRKFAGKLAL